MYDARTSQWAYSKALYRDALDAWDMEYLTSDDLRRFCLYIEKGKYNGTTLEPTTSTQRVE